MQKNQFTLFNGPPVELSLDFIRERGMLIIPPIKDILRFDNYARFLADVTCVHDTEDSTMLTVNYGNVFDVLNDRDIYHEFYSVFLQKTYPLILNNTILLSPGRVDVVLVDGGNQTRFCSNVPGRHVDTRDVHIVRADQVSDCVRILSQKDHALGDVSAPHLSQFSEDEIGILRSAGHIDSAYSMCEAWGNASEEEIAKAIVFQEKYQESGGKVYKNPTYANEAITGMVSVYEIEIDCRGFNTDTILFENIFLNNICLQRDCPEYLEEQADYWVESTVMDAMAKEEYDIGTSLLLTQIDPEFPLNIQAVIR